MQEEFDGNQYRSLAGLDAWQFGRIPEPVIDPELPIVDAHHHLWHDSRGRYLLEDFRADYDSGHNIVATVYVEAGAMYRGDAEEAMQSVGEVQFAAGVAAMSESGFYGSTRIGQAIVGYTDLTAGGVVDAVLDAQIVAGGGKFRGIRQAAHWDEILIGKPALRPMSPRGLLLDTGLWDGLERLRARGLLFEALAFHTQIDELLQLVDAHPELRIVVNHVGCPLGVGSYAGRREELFGTWRSGIQALAERGNVVMKLGGLGMLFPGFDFHLRPTPPASRQLADAWRPYIETCIEAFGPTRCLFESNFPVDKQSCDYATLWNAFKRIARQYSTEERANLFAGTARAAYGI